MPLVIAMKATDSRSRKGLAIFPDRYANERVEFGYSALCCVDDLVLCFKEFNCDEPRIFVDEEGGIAVSTKS